MDRLRLECRCNDPACGDERLTLLGKTIGRFRVLSLLGRGGMGEVYVAYDETLDRRVALKSIVASRRLQPSAQARFRREARALSRLDHPNICRIYDYVEMETHDFLVLELVTGRRLDEAIRAGLGRDTQLRIAGQIASALVAAHAEGIVHRDLKPNNVMLSDTGEVKVLDFGLAWTAGERPAPQALATLSSAGAETELPPTEAGFLGAAASGVGRASAGVAETPAESLPAWDPAPASFEHDGVHTEIGMILGTPAYMSPEQARGETATTASDMYSLGLVLQFLFTGRAPQPEGLDSTELVRRALRAESLAPIGLAKDLAALIAQLKAGAPAARPTAVEIARRLGWIREAPRRRLRRIAAAAALMVAILAGVKYTFDLRAERSLAVAAQAEAERRRGQAEDLIQFMLGDLRERLESVGRLDALDGVAAKALDYFASVGAEQLTDADLFRRSRALTQIGEVRIAQGDLGAARKVLNEARAASSDLVARQPRNGDWLMGLGAIEFWLGNVDWLQGDLAAAEERFRAYLAVADRLVAIDGAKPEWRMEQAYAHSNLGTVQNARGDVDAALEHFRLTVDVERQLVVADPKDPRWQKELASGLSWLGEVLFGRGELGEARAFYDEGRAVLQRLTRLTPEDAGYRFLLALQRRNLGTTLESLGRLDEAITEYGESLALHRQLLELDPANADWRREVAVSHMRLGSASVRADTTAALRHLKLAADTLAELLATDTTNSERRFDLGYARIELARGLLAAEEAAAAVVEARNALATLGPGAGEADDRPRRMLEGEIRLALGDALHAAGRRAEARTAWTEAVSALQPLGEGNRDPRVLAPLAQALLGLGRRTEAQPLIERLRAGGYRRAPFENPLR